MTQRTPSPFTGLDKALLKPTRSRQKAVLGTDVGNGTQAPPSSRADIETSRDDKDITIASTISFCPEIVEIVRKEVKGAGKEATLFRLSASEKAQLADLAHAYKRQGKKTSETEICRIALNYILEEHKVNREESILARVINALLA